jgi:hypothetical protein
MDASQARQNYDFYRSKSIEDWWQSYSPGLFATIAEVSQHQNSLTIEYGPGRLTADNSIFIGQYSSKLKHELELLGYSIHLSTYCDPWEITISW